MFFIWIFKIFFFINCKKYCRYCAHQEPVWWQFSAVLKFLNYVSFMKIFEETQIYSSVVISRSVVKYEGCTLTCLIITLTEIVMFSQSKLTIILIINEIGIHWISFAANCSLLLIDYNFVNRTGIQKITLITNISTVTF